MPEALPLPTTNIFCQTHIEDIDKANFPSRSSSVMPHEVEPPFAMMPTIDRNQSSSDIEINQANSRLFLK
ncbi:MULTISPECIES: hypothetical protein [Pseudomonadota]|uniref:hypothetical protein n=1 Tax=Pseudomonadota TaxID=1224 RepID=UPI00128F49D1|nr:MULTISPECIES: hypothetical protein [Pseudomonadota]